MLPSGKRANNACSISKPSLWQHYLVAMATSLDKLSLLAVLLAGETSRAMLASARSLVSFCYSCFIYLLAFHHFPFYQNSPTPFPRPDVVGGD